ncbi:MAG: hypothetical protein IPJ32_00120 [Sphingobacteriaceae bacterium]|jgi:hypothetical protein|nr:hypothetical protein [Sphingobacteriaceae bacterium]MDO9187391.1 hypothetical protein [Bacteroidia bacterium]
METWKKITVGTIIGGGLIGGTVYLLRLNKMNAELETVPMVKIHKLDFSGLTLRVDVQLKNPTRTPFKIKFPFIKLVYKGTTVGSSQVLDKDIQIPAFGEAIIDKMMIKVPLMNIFSLSGGLIKAIQNKEPVKLEVKTLTTIDIGWKKVPYTKADTITLSQGKA